MAKKGDATYQWQIMQSLGLSDDEIPLCIQDLKSMGEKLLKNKSWKVKCIKGVLNVLKKTVLTPCDESAPFGLKTHISDIYMEELAKVGHDEVMICSLLFHFLDEFLYIFSAEPYFIAPLQDSGKIMGGDAITSEELTETKECKREVNWSELPSIPLEKIYSFLNRFDRVKMSLVCRRWSEGYSSPSAWRTFKFDAKIWKNRCLGLKFAQKYGSMFRHVEITYHLLLPCTHGKDLIGIWRRNFLLFLKLLTRKSQLISLKIRDLLLCFTQEDTSIRDNIRKAIASFLRSQHHLKSVEFHNCFTNFQEYVELLGDLTEDSRNSITHFGLRGLSLCSPGNYDKDNC
ncbi:unnamed protein product [Larinioides sclopetarius]|uniref:F-box domain-containing protein n=1 Tax=Larinioides sclopetarius TaxID=280406 RepID=A0AAV2BHJ8_9ARAC